MAEPIHDNEVVNSFESLASKLYSLYILRPKDSFRRDSVKNSSSYFKNESCEYFPCHDSDGECFNCLFCYCPLYSLGEACGGEFVYTEAGVKDCSACLIPHSEDGYAYILSKLSK